MAMARCAVVGHAPASASAWTSRDASNSTRRGCAWSRAGSAAKLHWPGVVPDVTDACVSVHLSGNDGQHQMTRVLLVVIDLMYHRLAAANVIRRIFDIVRPGKAARQIEAGDIEANAVAGFEQIAGRQNLDLVFFDLAGFGQLLRGARQLMPWPPRL